MNVTSLLIRLSLLSISFFTSIGMLINLRFYTNSNLRVFLIPEDCPVPCLMNIQPGVTTVEQTITFLETSQWVGRIIRQPACLTWEWSGQQPDFMLVAAESERLPAFNHACHNVNENIIRHIWFAVKGLKTGEVILTNGLPERMYVTGISRPARYAEVYLAYFRQNIVVRTRVQCPMRPEQIWHGTVTEIYAVSPLRESPYNQSFDMQTLLNDEGC